jgi:hypothetical protein
MKMKAKRFLSLMMSVLLILTLLPLTALAEGGEIPSEADGFYPYVRYLECKGIMEGLPDGTFRPEAVLTRADAAKIMVLAKNLPPVSGGDPTFPDVPAEHWAYSYIETAAGAGLMKGYPGGTFGPEKPITRVEAATLLLNLSGGALSDETLSIADVGEENWAYRQIVTAVKAGIMGLSSDGLFFPGTAFTRGEMAQSLYTLLTLSPALRKAELAGKLTVKTGNVKITDRDGSPHLLTKGQETRVTVGTTIMVETGSRAEISYDDGSGIRIEPKTQISILRSDGFNYMRPDGTPAVAVDKLEIKLIAGRIFGALANRNEGMAEDHVSPADEGSLQWWQYTYAARERIRVDMPTGVTGVFGTFWSNLVTPSGSGSTSVLAGNTEVSSGGQSVTVSGGQATSVPPAGGPPTPPAPLTPQQAQEFASAGGWVLQQAQEIQNNVPTPPMPPQQQGPQTPQQPGQPPVPPVAPPPVLNTIQQALDQASGVASPVTSPGPSRNSDSDSDSDDPTETAPTINGRNAITLTQGDSLSEPYTFGGYPAPTQFGIDFGGGEAWDAVSFSGGTLTISTELPVGEYTFTLTATNRAGTGTLPVTVNVNSRTITLSPETVPDAVYGIDYTTTLTASGGTEPYTFEITGGMLPEGMTLSESGEISGTFNVGNISNYMFTVTVTDSKGNIGEQEYVIHVYDQISVAYTFRDWGDVPEDFPVAWLTATGGAGGTYTFTLSDVEATKLSEYGATLELQPNGDIIGQVIESTGEDGIEIDVDVTDGHGNTMTVPVTIYFMIEY